jgi:hypothetical protein
MPESAICLDCNPHIYASRVAGMTVMHHHILLLVEMGSLHFLPGLTLTLILPIATSQVARITGMSHHTQFVHPFLSFTYLFIFLVVLGFKFRASCLLGRCSVTLGHFVVPNPFLY